MVYLRKEIVVAAQVPDRLGKPGVPARECVVAGKPEAHSDCRTGLWDIRHEGERGYLTVPGKGGKIRFIPAHPRAIRLIEEYLGAAGHRAESSSPLFRAVAANAEAANQRLNPGSVYRNVVMYYCRRGARVAWGFEHFDNSPLVEDMELRFSMPNGKSFHHYFANGYLRQHA